MYTCRYQHSLIGLIKMETTFDVKCFDKSKLIANSAYFAALARHGEWGTCSIPYSHAQPEVGIVRPYLDADSVKCSIWIMGGHEYTLDLSILDPVQLLRAAGYFCSNMLVEFVLENLLNETTCSPILVQLLSENGLEGPYVHIVLNYIQRFIGISRCEAVKLTQKEGGTFVCRPLARRVHNSNRKMQRFWNHHQSIEYCGYCNEIIPRFTTFLPPNAKCRFLPCCYTLVHVTCYQADNRSMHLYMECPRCETPLTKEGRIDIDVDDIGRVMKRHVSRKARKVSYAAVYPSVKANCRGLCCSFKYK